MPDYKVRTAADWTAQLQREAKAKCSSTFTELARNEMSITYERRSVGCRADIGQNARIHKYVQMEDRARDRISVNHRLARRRCATV